MSERRAARGPPKPADGSRPRQATGPASNRESTPARHQRASQVKVTGQQAVPDSEARPSGSTQQQSTSRPGEGRESSTASEGRPSVQWPQGAQGGSVEQQNAGLARDLKCSRFQDLQASRSVLPPTKNARRCQGEAQPSPRGLPQQQHARSTGGRENLPRGNLQPGPSASAQGQVAGPSGGRPVQGLEYLRNLPQHGTRLNPMAPLPSSRRSVDSTTIQPFHNRARGAPPETRLQIPTTPREVSSGRKVVPRRRGLSHVLQGVFLKTELFLAPKCPARSGEGGAAFVEDVAWKYNAEMPDGYPKMEVLPYDVSGVGSASATWKLSQVPIEHGKKAPDARYKKILLTSLCFNVSANVLRHAQWEKIVDATWRHLEKHYLIREDKDCWTTIQVYRTASKYSISELKRLSTAIVHFELVFRKVMDDPDNLSRVNRPPHARNWRDNLLLGKVHATRAESIAVIARIAADEDNRDHLQTLMDPRDRIYSWSMWGTLMKGVAEAPVIEYKQPWASTNALEVIRWIDTIVHFVQGAFACPPQRLQRYKADVKGMGDFMRMGVHGPAEECRMRLMNREAYEAYTDDTWKILS